MTYAFSASTCFSHLLSNSCIVSGGFLESDILKRRLRVPLIMAVTTTDICRSLIPSVALLNLAMKSFSGSSLPYANCIRLIAVFLTRLLLEKCVAKLLENSSNVRIDFEERVAIQSLASRLNVGGKTLHIITSGWACNLIKSTKDLR
ncbi:hypothetical protein Adt_03474 [Abeliophyllum distichum]|uniref:Uncharacterized protein n=1 Tax=Abeliophyllum distichum TaxID=126358 RepID=A0ABD1VZ36_9LAMI